LLLGSFLPTTIIITLNYRLSPIPSPHTFPIPVFDTLKALDYITSTKSRHNAGQTPRLSLYGSHIGGLLATTLALTEPTRIHALAVSEPVVDWVSLDEVEEESKTKRPNPKRKPKSAQPATPPDPSRLLSIRSKLFRTPETYFDAFASPILFLRAPGRDCPSDNSDPFLASLSPAAQAIGPYHDDLDAHPSTSSYQAPKRRKVLRRWPPNTTNPTLPPHTRVYVRDTPRGEAGVLRAQGEELVEVMRRACFYGREGGTAQARVQVQKMSDTPESEVEGIIGVREAAMWLREKFEED
jgi:pimeloyl-ACP methyl ester carboxylesterase